MATNESPSTKTGKSGSKPAKPRARAPKPAREQPVVLPGDDQIRLRAYELYTRRDGVSGDPVEDWLRAERELIEEVTPKP